MKPKRYLLKHAKVAEILQKCADLVGWKLNVIPVLGEKMTKSKRDIFKFTGSVPTAINLEKVCSMSIENSRITFSFGSNGIYVDMETPEVAQNVFEELLKAWSGD